MSPSVLAQGLSKSFGELQAVCRVDLAVSPGEVLGFLGPNGAGKSTTMRLLVGYLAPSGGRVSICGLDMASRGLEARRCIGYLPEGAPVYPEMTVSEFLRFIAAARGLDRRARREGILAAVERTQLGDVLHQTIETLSKGFKRRVGLAQAILHEPSVLILDEPTDGLDPNQKAHVRELIRGMAGEGDERGPKAIVLSTHILEEVEAVCSRAVIINRGVKVFDGTPAELDAMAPASVQRHRLDHVFRALTSVEESRRTVGGSTG